MLNRNTKTQPECPQIKDTTTNKSNDFNSLLDETLEYLKQLQLQQKQQKQQCHKKGYTNLESFKLLQNNLNQLKVPKSQRTLFQLIISYWDIIGLAILNIIFATYLAYFVASYFYSPPTFNLYTTFYSQLDALYKWLISKWMQWNNFSDYTSEECAAVMPDLLNSIFRPKDNCGMCQPNVLTEIKRVKNISKEEFLAKYAYTGVPVIITDAIKNWSALRILSFGFLKDLYLDINAKNTFDKYKDHNRNNEDSRLACQFFPYKTKFKSLVEVFEMDEERFQSPWYVGWSNCNNYASKVLRKHYKRPYFLPDDSEMSRLDWIFMGTPGYGAEIHIDDVNNPSWQAQISGIKKWTFKPVAECLFKCPFTLYADVYPGDIIVFDSNRWFHSTHIVGEDISLTIGSEYD